MAQATPGDEGSVAAENSGDPPAPAAKIAGEHPSAAEAPAGENAAALTPLPRGVTQPIAGELLRLAGPVFASQLLRIGYQWVDALWVKLAPSRL